MHQLEISQEEIRAIYQGLLQRRLDAIGVMAKIEEPELMLLKGHLLIEEVLFAMLNFKMRNASSLEKARLSFAQIISLVEGLYFGEDLNQSWLYASCHQLNKIRNRLAHNAKPDGMDHEIKHFIEFVIGHMKPDFSPNNPLRYALGSIHGNFSGILTLHEKVALIPAPFKGMSFESQITVSKVLVKSGESDA